MKKSWTKYTSHTQRCDIWNLRLMRAGSNLRCKETSTRSGSRKASRWRGTWLNRIHTGTRGIPRLCRYETAQLMKDYPNCSILLTSTRCIIFFFYNNPDMGDLLGSFPRKYVSENKTCWKDPRWFVGTVVNLKSNRALYNGIKVSSLQFGVVRGRTRQKLVGM